MDHFWLLVFFSVSFVVYATVEIITCNESSDKANKLSQREVFAFVMFLFVGWMFTNGISSSFYKSATIGFSFLVIHIVKMKIRAFHPLEAGGAEVSEPDVVVPVGIIDFVWLTINAFFLTIILFVRETYFCAQIAYSKSMPLAYLEKSYELNFFIMEEAIQAIIIVGGVLVSCMAILWGEAIWRKKGSVEQKIYKTTTIVAIKMVVAFFVPTIAMVVWVGYPTYNNILNLLQCFT